MNRLYFLAFGRSQSNGYAVRKALDWTFLAKKSTTIRLSPACGGAIGCGSVNDRGTSVHSRLETFGLEFHSEPKASLSDACISWSH